MMKKKPYSDTEVESLLRDLVRHDRCRMDDAMSERLLEHIRHVAQRCSRRQKYKRAALLAACLSVPAVSIPLLCGDFAPAQGPGPVAASSQTPPGGTAAAPAQRRRIGLGDLDGSLELGFRPEPQQHYDGGGNRRYGSGLHAACTYTACTDTL